MRIIFADFIIGVNITGISKYPQILLYKLRLILLKSGEGHETGITNVLSWGHCRLCSFAWMKMILTHAQIRIFSDVIAVVLNPMLWMWVWMVVGTGMGGGRICIL